MAGQVERKCIGTLKTLRNEVFEVWLLTVERRDDVPG